MTKIKLQQKAYRFIDENEAVVKIESVDEILCVFETDKGWVRTDISIGRLFNSLKLGKDNKSIVGFSLLDFFHLQEGVLYMNTNSKDTKSLKVSFYSSRLQKDIELRTISTPFFQPSDVFIPIQEAFSFIEGLVKEQAKLNLKLFVAEQEKIKEEEVDIEEDINQEEYHTSDTEFTQEDIEKLKNEEL